MKTRQQTFFENILRGMEKPHSIPQLVFDRIFSDILMDYPNDIRFNRSAKDLVRIQMEIFATEYIRNQNQQ